MDQTKSKTEAAAALGVSVDTLDRWRDRGLVRVVRIGRAVRVPQAEIDRLATHGTEPPKAA